jgi:hypothetical protein
MLAGASGGTDDLTLDGVCIQELGLTSGRNYFYDRTSAGAATIAASSTVTRTITVPAGQSFTVKHVRATHAALGSHVVVKLKNPQNVEIELNNGGGSDPTSNQWYSDDELRDLAVQSSDTLAELIGGDSAGTWTFTWTADAGLVGVVFLDYYGLELR